MKKRNKTLAPYDERAYKRVRKTPVRSPDETTITFNCSKEMKVQLLEQANASDRPLSQVIRYGLEYHIERKWVDIPQVRG